MPIGSPAEYAKATGRDRGNVYRSVRKGVFRFPDAELYWEEKRVPRVRWKLPKEKKVKG